jgi:hypothetical protein
MLVTAEAPVNVPTAHDPRPDCLDRIEQFAATYMLDVTGVRVEMSESRHGPTIGPC